MKNLSRKFATMTDEERRRFEQEQGRTAAGNEDDAADELELDEPRDEDRMGRHYPSLDAEIADPDNRDGAAATLDDAAHRRAVDKERKGRRREG